MSEKDNSNSAPANLEKLVGENTDYTNFNKRIMVITETSSKIFKLATYKQLPPIPYILSNTKKQSKKKYKTLKTIR